MTLPRTYVLGRVIPQRGKGRRRAVPLRHPPRYPPDVWSVHHLMDQGLPRSNNYQEAWHRRFEVVVGRHHLGIYPTIHQLQREQHRTEHLIVRWEAGNPAKKYQSAITKEREQRMTTVFQRFQEGNSTMDEFLRGMAHNFQIEQTHGNEDDVDDVDDEDEDPMMHGLF